VEKAIQELEGQVSVAHYDMRFLKPLDEDILQEVGSTFSRVITVEDGVRMGGFGSAVLEWFADHHFHPDITRMGLPDNFVEHGSVEQLHEIVGIDKENIKQEILR
jgi:1-deoxy-D-xylulose-5-phosphate synthase